MKNPNEIINVFEKVKIDYDLSSLSEDIQEAIPFIKKAMDGITNIFLKQQNEKLFEIYNEVLASKDNEKKEFYKLFKGPYNQLDNFSTVYPEDLPNRAVTCAFYPEDLTKEEFETFVSSLNDKEKELFLSNYSVIRRENGKLKAIPFHKYYAEELAEIFEALQKAGEIVNDETLKNYLFNRAEGLISGNYRESDSNWVKLTKSEIDLVIGPFEVYADGLMGLKATYEAMLMVIDHQKGEKLKEIEDNLDKLSEIFPLPVNSKSAVGGIAPMEVVHQIYSSGEASQGIMASAFNLPNDPWVRGNVGWKQVMIYNVMQSKFNACTKKIATKISNGKIKADFDPYFYFVLLHEVSHGLGPAYRKDGRNVAKCIGSAYTAIEEAKADTGALYLMLHLGGKYGIPFFEKQDLLDSYFAGLFRSMRFGVHEAHGAANVIEFNWLKEKGVIILNEDGSFSTNSEKLIEAADSLINKLCEIEANATPEEADEFLKKYALPGAEILKAIDSLKDIPIDIRVEYPV
jgi:hypothetical protein